LSETRAEYELITIITIGHSVAPIDVFIQLLREARIETLVDVRSVPYSRRVPHANRENLKGLIEHAGLTYVYLGDKIGGKTDDPAMQLPSGKTDYELVRQSVTFREGIDELVALASESNTAIMCAEENPAHCHRTALIAPALIELKCNVTHIRHDGSTESQEEVENRLTGGQLSLF
jgi:uncharacterized protein (DUF488 family)